MHYRENNPGPDEPVQSKQTHTIQLLSRRTQENQTTETEAAGKTHRNQTLLYDAVQLVQSKQPHNLGRIAVLLKFTQDAGSAAAPVQSRANSISLLEQTGPESKPVLSLITAPDLNHRRARTSVLFHLFTVLFNLFY